MPSSDALPPAQLQMQRNLADMQQRIAAACARAGRDPSQVRLLPVSKTVPAEQLRLAHAAGLRMLGENKVQEAYGKWQALGDLPGLRWSIIGHLQSNKARQVAQFADEFQALDSLALAQELDRRLQQHGRSLDVLVQVNTSGEASKFGLPASDVPRFVQQLAPCSALRVRGLMTLAMPSSDPAPVRDCFVQLRQLLQRLQQETALGAQLSELSMGMSGDFEWAIEEGATIVRIGQAIFGARPSA
ncbi:YggS family pyridoxal phosphate-dependent enzyme [Vandammella animalimorsus]|uniref:Pyridoxal phosphate homeostasis protein n=1 Tax=Vandammella animalimorsus TaxID=2029117 RepID=A0A3M6RLL4_9BURK|nr:YggS family pyridoxal phosphate-dependent enzyme [Vandammella animalimorsus]RMX15602.1 YggS family pyridoxal phosphate-dependent enzyme [Vandammella animalimorsus]